MDTSSPQTVQVSIPTWHGPRVLTVRASAIERREPGDYRPTGVWITAKQFAALRCKSAECTCGTPAVLDVRGLGAEEEILVAGKEV